MSTGVYGLGLPVIRRPKTNRYASYSARGLFKVFYRDIDKNEWFALVGLKWQPVTGNEVDVAMTERVGFSDDDAGHMYVEHNGFDKSGKHIALVLTQVPHEVRHVFTAAPAAAEKKRARSRSRGRAPAASAARKAAPKRRASRSRSRGRK